MNINQIYGEQEPFIKRGMTEFYNHFARALESDMDYQLSDDEVGELFNELMLKYMRDTMSYNEWTRVITEINK